MSVLSGVGRFFFLLRSYCQMLSEQSHPMSNFQDRAKHPTLVIPPPKELKWIVGNIFYNKFNHTIIIKSKNISFSGKIMETAHWRKGEKDYTSMWQRKEKVGHLVCEKLVTNTSLKWLKYLGILMFIQVFIGLKIIFFKKLESFLDGKLGWWSFWKLRWNILV